MKKKLFIASAVILVFFLALILLSLRPSQKNSNPQLIDNEQTKQIIQDGSTAADTISAVYEKYPWYGKIPIVTNDYTIAFNFEKNSFRVIFLKPSTESMKRSALESINNIGANLDQYDYYFIEPEKSGFKNLLR